MIGSRRTTAVVVGLVLVAGLVLTVVMVGGLGGRSADGGVGSAQPVDTEAATAAPSTSAAADSETSPSQPPSPSAGATADQPRPAPSPEGRIFGRGRFLVAYYGTGGTGALGVLGETDPDTAFRRLKRAGAPFARPGRPVQPVFELIVTIADAVPGEDGDYSHDIARREVRRYIAAAHRHDALVVLDLQPGRSSFLEVAKRWAWALRDTHVGLALDPEWRMGRDEVPGRVIGSVDATEINAVTRWLADLQRRHGLPQKLLVLHQFRTDMIERIGQVQPRPSLAFVQHVDGFGTPGQKRATFHTVVQPQKFYPGFKLFYDEDTHLMSARDVHRIRPRVRFVSYQ